MSSEKDEVILEMIIINNLEELLDKIVDVEKELLWNYNGNPYMLRSYAYKIVEIVMNHISGV